MNGELSKTVMDNGEASPSEEKNTDTAVTANDGTDTEFSDPSDESKKTWKNSENAENARRRREEERQRRAVREARESGIIEALGGINPYTGENITDSRDIDEYLAMKEIEKEGGDPLTDFARYHKQKQKAADEAAAEETRQARWIENDRENFISRYPDVNINDLVSDENFRMFAEGKTGNMPLAEIYSGYMQFVEHYETQAKSHAAQLYANHKASPGSLGSTGSAGGFFTPDQVRAMSPAEVKANFDVIKKSMKNWK